MLLDKACALDGSRVYFAVLLMDRLAFQFVKNKGFLSTSTTPMFYMGHSDARRYTHEDHLREKSVWLKKELLKDDSQFWIRKPRRRSRRLRFHVTYRCSARANSSYANYCSYQRKKEAIPGLLKRPVLQKCRRLPWVRKWKHATPTIGPASGANLKRA